MFTQAFNSLERNPPSKNLDDDVTDKKSGMLTVGSLSILISGPIILKDSTRSKLSARQQREERFGSTTSKETPPVKLRITVQDGGDLKRKLSASDLDEELEDGDIPPPVDDDTKFTITLKGVF